MPRGLCEERTQTRGAPTARTAANPARPKDEHISLHAWLIESIRHRSLNSRGGFHHDQLPLKIHCCASEKTRVLRLAISGGTHTLYDDGIRVGCYPEPRDRERCTVVKRAGS
jgi:hypothetical protein